jgi:hypothetical protein
MNTAPFTLKKPLGTRTFTMMIEDGVIKVLNGEEWIIKPFSFSSKKKPKYKRASFSFNKNKETKLYLHRLIYFAHNPSWNIFDNKKNNLIDHIDKNPLNCNIENLRVVNQQQNSFNRNVRGYSFDKVNNKYRAVIKVNGIQIFIGYYETHEQAHQAYLNKKSQLHII